MAEMSTRNLISTLSKHIRAKMRDGDYYDDNNILRCGKCGEPREFLYDNWMPKVFDSGMKNMLYGVEPRYVVRPAPCRCDIEAEEREKARIEKAALERTIRDNRARCFDIKGYEDVTFADDEFMSEWCSYSQFPRHSRIAKLMPNIFLWIFGIEQFAYPIFTILKYFCRISFRYSFHGLFILQMQVYRSVYLYTIAQKQIMQEQE